MLSKPDVESSDGRYFAASMSRSSRSRTTLAYSVRFSRCSPGGGVNGFAVAIELVLERRDHRVEVRRVGALHAERRHLSRAHLAHDQFPLLAVRVHVRRVERVDAPAGAPNPGPRPLPSRCGRPCSTGSGMPSVRPR